MEKFGIELTDPVALECERRDATDGRRDESILLCIQ